MVITGQGDLSEQQIRVLRLLIRPRQQARPLFVFDFVGRPVVLVGYAGFLWEGSVAADFAYEFGKEAGAHRELAEQDAGLVINPFARVEYEQAEDEFLLAVYFGVGAGDQDRVGLVGLHQRVVGGDTPRLVIVGLAEGDLADVFLEEALHLRERAWRLQRDRLIRVELVRVVRGGVVRRRRLLQAVARRCRRAAAIAYAASRGRVARRNSARGRLHPRYPVRLRLRIHEVHVAALHAAA